jgi:transcription termination/antitermination protein NusG
MDDPTAFPFEDCCGQWHVLHVKSRQEKALSDDLQIRGIAHFLPLIRQPRLYGRRKAVVEVPLFPGYLFLKGTLEDAYTADRTGRVARVIQVNDQERISGELSSVRVALTQDGPLDPYPYLKEGLRVRVRYGPLEGLEGFIESKHKRDRLIIQVEVLGQAVSMEIDGASLELL